MVVHARTKVPRSAKQVLLLWCAFFCAALVLNLVIPLVGGGDLRAWTYSRAKEVLFGVVVYGGLFMVGPIVLVKGPTIARGPGVWVPLVLAITALGLRPLYRPLVLTTLGVLVYLHARYDLSGLGVKLPMRRRDLVAIVLLGLLPMAIRVFSPQPWAWHPSQALRAGLDRLLLNPASTTENLFYFGLMAERLRPWAGRWGTPALVGAMYTAHEMSNPEYWYEGMSFPVVFLGVAITTTVYLWCRNTVSIWLSSGLARFVTALW